MASPTALVAIATVLLTLGLGFGIAGARGAMLAAGLVAMAVVLTYWGRMLLGDSARRRMIHFWFFTPFTGHAACILTAKILSEMTQASSAVFLMLAVAYFCFQFVAMASFNIGTLRISQRRLKAHISLVVTGADVRAALRRA